MQKLQPAAAFSHNHSSFLSNAGRACCASNQRKDFTFGAVLPLEICLTTALAFPREIPHLSMLVSYAGVLTELTALYQSAVFTSIASREQPGRESHTQSCQFINCSVTGLPSVSHQFRSVTGFPTSSGEKSEPALQVPLTPRTSTIARCTDSADSCS